MSNLDYLRDDEEKARIIRIMSNAQADHPAMPADVIFLVETIDRLLGEVESALWSHDEF